MPIERSVDIDRNFCITPSLAIYLFHLLSLLVLVKLLLRNNAIGNVVFFFIDCEEKFFSVSPF